MANFWSFSNYKKVIVSDFVSPKKFIGRLLEFVFKIEISNHFFYTKKNPVLRFLIYLSDNFQVPCTEYIRRFQGINLETWSILNFF